MNKEEEINKEDMNKEEEINKEDMNKEEEIDWKALDKGWADDYEETYGHLFGNNTVKSE